MLDVGLLLRTQDLHHRVERRDDLVEVPSGLQRGREPRKVEVVEAVGEACQPLIGALAARVAAAAELQEGRRGLAEGVEGIRARQDLDSLAHALQLHGAQAAALVPLLGFDLARRLRLIEELLVGVQLCLGGIKQLLALSEGHALGGMVELLLFQRLLQGFQLPHLRGHQLLESLLRVGLLGIGLLQVAGEGVVHAFEDALDLGGLRGIIAEGIVAELRSAQGASAARGEVRGALDEVADGSHVLVGKALGGRGPLEDASDARDDAEELRLLDRRSLQELACARAGQRLGRRLEGTDALFALRLLTVVVLEIVVPHGLRLCLRVQVLRYVFLELLDLGAMRGDLTLELDDQRMRILDRGLLIADVFGLAGEGRLAPACILVVRLLLEHAIPLDPGLHPHEQLNNLSHRCLAILRLLELNRARARQRGRKRRNEEAALHCAQGGRGGGGENTKR
mmetsp:Transcript_120857/g.385936  ORF Transcript_120857/g.385936 Transcript_120857/m.385936 type:complete len:453 (+) Transcript_120857:898-2256(+)